MDIELQSLYKSYDEGGSKRYVLRDAEARFASASRNALLGKSGSGKSTVLNLLGGLDTADSGSILIEGLNLAAMNEEERTLFRRRHIGFVFQFFNLIPMLNVMENILLPSQLDRKYNAQLQRRAMELLDAVGLADRHDSSPDILSGGEQQRVAIVRALVSKPLLILADEPTGNLDASTGEQVLKLLLDLTHDAGSTLILATHSADILPFMDTTFTVYNGRLNPFQADSFLSRDSGITLQTEMGADSQDTVS